MTLQRSEVPALYAITDPSRGPHRDIAVQLNEAGAKWIQIREKEMTDAELYEELVAIARALSGRATVFVNDRADLALATGADGVHLGDEDLPPALARRAAGPRPLLIGYSTHSLEEVQRAAEDPAVDYIAIGPIFRSATKDVRDPRGLEFVRRARASTSKPLIAIGGINRANIGEVIRAGADGVAVIAALYGPPSIAASVRGLLQEAMAAR